MFEGTFKPLGLGHTLDLQSQTVNAYFVIFNNLKNLYIVNRITVKKVTKKGKKNCFIRC